MRTRSITVMFLALLVTVPSIADEDVAKLLFAKGEKSFRQKKYEDAEGNYRRALEELSPYPEAAYGLARSLEKLGRTQEALDAYLRCRDEIKDMESPSRSLRRIRGKADKAISKLGKDYAELADLDKAFAKKAFDFGRKYFNKSPAWSKKFFGLVLKVHPDHKLATSYLERLGDVSAPATAIGGFEPWLTDDAMKNWDPGAEAPFKCRGGILSATPPDGGGYSNFVKSRCDGSYSYRAAFRVTGRIGPRRAHGLLFGMKKTGGGTWALLVDFSDSLTLSYLGSTGSKDVKDLILSGVDFEKWHVIEARVEPGRVGCFLDGKEIFTYSVESEDEFDGTPGLFVQDIHVEVKEVGVQR